MGQPAYGSSTVSDEMLEHLRGRLVACRACPRLVVHRERMAQERRAAFRDETYWGRPVPGFGDAGAHLAIVGLAPAAHGANRTGRMFTGDGPRGASATLMAALHRAGMASSPSSERAGDGLQLSGVYLTAVVRCAPPGNRPSSDELARCRSFLVEELACLPRLQTVLALGRTAFEGCAQVLGTPRRPRFAHGTVLDLGAGRPRLVGSYHPSRQNTQTGRLTSAMLDEVLRVASVI